jgi:hypothetical protein
MNRDENPKLEEYFIVRKRQQRFGLRLFLCSRVSSLNHLSGYTISRNSQYALLNDL